MRAVSIVGPKKSGKTTLGLELAIALGDMGLKVAVAKHTCHGFDKEDTDTGRYRKVCSGVIGLSPEESMISWPGERFLPDLVHMVEADILIVEGGKSFGWLPRILVFDEKGEADKLKPELAIACYGQHGLPHAPKFVSVAELAELVAERGFMLPGLDCGACGCENCHGLAAEIVAGRADLSECKSLNTGMKIKVDGKPVALNPFVEEMFLAVIKSMLGQLKGYSPGQVRIDMEG